MMNCSYCSGLVQPHRDSWVKGSDGRRYHTECLRMKQQNEEEGHEDTKSLSPSCLGALVADDEDDGRAAEIGIAPGQGRTAGEVLRAGELVVLMILCMFGVAGFYWWIRFLEWITG